MAICGYLRVFVDLFQRKESGNATVQGVPAFNR
jgi:hypothetical protein